MKSISVKQAQAFDQAAQEKFGIPSIILMENAGRGVAKEAIEMGRWRDGEGRVAIVCGVGNNGGDGLVAARHLLNAGAKVSVYIVGKTSKLKADPKINLKILKKMGQRVKIWKPRSSFAGFHLIIDALFGIGLKSEVRSPFAEVIEQINKSKKPVLAVDVPSGLDADTGKVLGVAVKAKKTVTFVALKKGFNKPLAKKYCGKIIVRDIGIS